MDLTIATSGLWEWDKQAEINSDTGWGSVKIIFYPTGAAIPPRKQPQAAALPRTASAEPVVGSAASAPKP